MKRKGNVYRKSLYCKNGSSLMCVYGYEKDVLTFVIIQKTEDEALRREEKSFTYFTCHYYNFFPSLPSPSFTSSLISSRYIYVI